MRGIKLFVGVLACMYSLTSWGVRPLLCLIQPDRVAEVGSPVVGIVSSIRVERGDWVKKGQILAKLRSRVEAASLQVAKTRAQADADVRSALANYSYLKQQQTRSEELVEQNFISQQALEKARAETKVAAERLSQAREQQELWKREVDLANAQLSLRSIRAPFSGVIADRYVSVGERIEDKPMFRIAQVDPLRIEVVVPVAMFGSVKAGMIARVNPELPDIDDFDAEIVLVDRLVDAASNTFRVRASFPNAKGRIPSGLRCTAQLMEAPAKKVSKKKMPAKRHKKAAGVPTKSPVVRKLQADLAMDTDLSLRNRDKTVRSKAKQ